MAQIAIPLLLLGTAVLISNDENDENEQNDKENPGKENMTNLTDIDPRGDLLSKEYSDFYPNIEKSKNNINNQQDTVQYQDKYFLKNVSAQEQKSSNSSNDSNVFKTLAGEQIKSEDINHNNMNLYFGGKTNGVDSINSSSILDTYTGQGTYDIKKEEIATFFKPENNTQNVYGNQNKNDFYQSRVNASQRHANDKPWQEIKVSPGINKKYNDNVTTSGFNNYNESRDTWMPKSVDDLRTSNNPKNVYCLHDHMGPAIKAVQNRGHQGKIVKKSPDSKFIFAKGSLLCASKPADTKMTSGLNFSTGVKTFFSKIS